jgi:hypothetical protein
MRTVIGLFDQFEDAQQVARSLVDAGFPRDDLSLIAADSHGDYAKHVPGETSSETEKLGGGAAAGAGIGAAAGGLAGLLAGLGALAIPGIGPVIAAGPLAAALAGAGIGAAAGGLLGALVNLGIPEEHAKLYAEGVRRGGTLVMAKVQDSQTEQAVQIMNRFHPVDINQRSRTWDRGHSETEGGTETMSAAEMERERRNLNPNPVPVTGQRADEMTMPVTDREMDAETLYRQDFQRRYATTGGDFKDYLPAYRYGYELRTDPRYEGYQWADVELLARQDWDRRGMPTAWEEVKDAVRYAWDSLRR